MQESKLVTNTKLHQLLNYNPDEQALGGLDSVEDIKYTYVVLYVCKL